MGSDTPEVSEKSAPTPESARERYDEGASRYDLTTRLLARPRRMAVEALHLRAGEIVLDVACGTGLNLPMLSRAVGSDGQVIGVDISPGMLAVAEDRVAANDLANVELLLGDVLQIGFPDADAALFSFTHDVLRTPAAVRAVTSSLRSNGRVAAAGVKYAHPVAIPINVAVRAVAPHFITTREGLRRPWSHLEAAVGQLEIESLLFGSLYVAYRETYARSNPQPASDNRRTRPR